MEQASWDDGHLARRSGIFIGIAIFAFVMVVPAPAGLSDAAWSVVALAGLMGVWWATEAIPIPVTSLLPVIILPLVGAAATADAASPYAHPIIFLLLGGFIAAMGMQRWGLHRRIALFILAQVGDHPAALIAGFMAASAFLSMWISNTATTLMIVPIALTVAQTILGHKAKGHHFTIIILIGCAWAASIGGLGTYIGTPPNLFVKAFIEQATGREILFLEWMAFAIPVVLVMVPLAWFVLTRMSFRFDASALKGGSDVVAAERAKLGAMSLPEKRVAAVLLSMAGLWMTRQWLVEWQLLTDFIPFIAKLRDTHVAVMGAFAMFLVPSGDKAAQGRGLLSWDEAVQLPWGVILLFGGGLSLAAAIQSSGLAVYLGEALSPIATAPLFLMIFAVVFLIVFLTELTSNTATTAAFVPVMAAIAGGADFNPILLAAPVAMAASCAFMLPVATGPNAVIFSTGEIRVPQMMRAGRYLNLIGSFVVAALCYTLVPLVFGLS